MGGGVYMAGVTGKGAPQRQRVKAEPAPTTPDPIEIAMEAAAGDTSPDSPARRVLLKQEALIGWQIASERAGFALKVLTGLVGLGGAAAWTASGSIAVSAWTNTRSASALRRSLIWRARPA